jgi:hypothetical protein
MVENVEAPVQAGASSVVNQALEDWLADRPQIIKNLARSHPPDSEYRLANGLDDDLYVIYSYNEDGTITVIRYARLAGAPDSVLPLWKVFGMKPEDLVRIDE